MPTLPGPLAPERLEAFLRHQEELKRRRAAGIEPDHFVGHPGFGESLIPVWGSGREAIADFQEGDYVGAGINGVAAASDLFLVGAVRNTAAKVAEKAAFEFAESAARKGLQVGSKEAESGGLRMLQKDIATVSKPTRAGTPPWNYERVRPRMKKYGLVGEGQELHHWLIPQGGWGKNVPNPIKNNPLNLHAKETVSHKLIHQNLPSQGLIRYTPVQRYLEGTPRWAKVATAGGGAHVTGAAKRKMDER